MDEETKEEKPLNIVDEARIIRDEIVRQKEELKKEKEELAKLRSEAILSSTAGTRPEQVVISPEDIKLNQAKEFFKGTELENAIIKANEKK